MSSSLNEKAKEIVAYAASKNLMVAQDAIAVLQQQEKPMEIIDHFASLEKGFITGDDANSYLAMLKTKHSNVTNEVEIINSGFRPLAKDIEPNFKWMKEYDITNRSNSEGKVENFIEMFRDKFEFLSSVLEKRTNLKPKKISQLKMLKKNEKADVIGMVSEKWVTKNGNLAIRIEDLEEQCIFIMKKDNSPKARDAENIILDDVIAIKGAKIAEGLFAMDEFFWPELEQRGITAPDRDLNLALISDVHAGSRLFIEKEFGEMINWLSGKTPIMNEREREELGKVKYLIVAGDNIDGIGVYPNQYEELAIKDLYEQYNKFSEYLLKIPEYIEVIICPGQHDAVRRADPQPAIPKEYVPELSDMKNVHFVGSPSWFEIEGLKSVIYHGASMHDLYMSVKNLNPKEPEKAIIEALKRRDLMASYGMNQPYIPEKKDYQLIRENPDLYFGGDMHHWGFGHYRGCTIMNGSTWQLQTDFEKEQGHSPTPGIALILKMKERRLIEKKFWKGESVA